MKEKLKVELDDPTPEEIMQMTQEELEFVPYELKKWQCQFKGCCNGTKMRDYGIAPFFHENSIARIRNGETWKDLTRWWVTCGKHTKLMKRLLKSFTEEHIVNKFFDSNPAFPSKVIDISSAKMKTLQHIEKK